MDLDRLLKLRLIVARCGEMDVARWRTRRASWGRAVRWFSAEGCRGRIGSPRHGWCSRWHGHAAAQCSIRRVGSVQREEAAELRATRSTELRSWFARGFWDGHIREYSRSRRRAPIYWQLSVASLRYSVWLYYHRVTSDTLYTVLNEFLARKVGHEESRLMRQHQAAAPNPTRSQAREIEEQERFVEELRAFQQEVARVAPLWNPDLNDGVIIIFAPLWRWCRSTRSGSGSAGSVGKSWRRGSMIGRT